MYLRLEPNSQPTFSSSSGQRVASSLRLRSASRASDTLMVNFSMAILIRPQPGVDTVRVQLLLIVPGSRANRKQSTRTKNAQLVHPGAFDAQRTLFRFSRLGIFLPGQIRFSRYWKLETSFWHQ